jgi:SAM-dependent methyltransferase
MNNYEFCTQWILDNKTENNVRVLDYGCGAGEIVKELRKQGVDAFGCDVFYEGGDCSKQVDSALLGSSIRRMEGKGCTIPFDSASFDYVINNQVMEHVVNLDSVLAEIQRVLKPGGVVLSLFPDKGVWREGHCGVPFLHWFPKCSRPRVYYAAVCRMAGLGYYKGNKSVMHWSQEFCEWLDKWTYYRTRQEIHSTYDKYFVELQHIEDYWLQQRLGPRKIVVTWLPPFAQKLVVRKLADLVFSARKP